MPVGIIQMKKITASLWESRSECKENEVSIFESNLENSLIAR